MDHENLCIASREIGDTEEVDMVLGQCKGRLVTRRISTLNRLVYYVGKMEMELTRCLRSSGICRRTRQIGRLHVTPRKGARVGNFHELHVEREDGRVRVCIWQASSRYHGNN